MHLRDRVKQTAFAISDTEYLLDGGVAADGMQTFQAAYKIDTTTTQVNKVKWPGLVVLVESGSNWQTVRCMLQRDNNAGGYAIKLLNGVVEESSTGAPLGLTGSQEVKVSLAASAAFFRNIAVAPAPTPASFLELMDGWNTGSARAPSVRGSDPEMNGGVGPTTPNGLLAIGDGAHAAHTGAVAIGREVNASYPHSWVTGYRGHSMNAAMQVHCLGRAYFANNVWQEVFHGRGIMNRNTTDATPGKLGVYDENGLVASSQDLYLDSGVHTFEGTLTAVDPATGDRKWWTLQFAISTSINYATTALFGALTKTVVQADAGAAAWDVTVLTDNATNTFAIQVTGEAAKNLSWAFTYDMHHHVVYP